jgi:hypothetical protein
MSIYVYTGFGVTEPLGVGWGCFSVRARNSSGHPIPMGLTDCSADVATGYGLDGPVKKGKVVPLLN